MIRRTLLLIPFALTLGPQSEPPVPSSDELTRRVRQALRLDFQLQQDFTYLERRRDVKISKLGKVTIGPLRTFEVYPSERPGGTYKRLVAVDGVPLGAEELARRDAEHARDLRLAAARERAETPRQRAARKEKAAGEERERDAIIEDALAVFAPTVARRDWLDDQAILVIDLEPRQAAHVRTREGRWMKRFAGQLWVAEADYQIVRVDMRAFADVTIGWGVIGRVHKGSRVLYSRRRFEHVWLPAETTYEASGRTLLFRPFEFSVTTTYSDYRRRK